MDACFASRGKRKNPPSYLPCDERRGAQPFSSQQGLTGLCLFSIMQSLGTFYALLIIMIIERLRVICHFDSGTCFLAKLIQRQYRDNH